MEDFESKRKEIERQLERVRERVSYCRWAKPDSPPRYIKYLPFLPQDQARVAVLSESLEKGEQLTSRMVSGRQ